MSNDKPDHGPQLTFDKQWVKPTGLRDQSGTSEQDRAGPFVSDIVNYIGETVGYRHWIFGLRPRMPIGGVVKRILVGIQLRKTDGASSSPHAPLSTRGDTAPNEPRFLRGITSDKAPSEATFSRFVMRKVRAIKSIADSLHERIAAHVIPLAQLFDGQKPATFRGWTRACLDHFLRRYREADQEAANADYKPVFLDADPATVEVKRLRPRRFERPLLAADTATTADVVAASLPPSKQNLAALKDRAPSLLPLLKGNEVVVFEALKSATSQRDIANATGLTEGAVSKILDRIISKAG
jgi:DNA-directed RNA polymerase specialized sigma24 family protein